MKQILFFSCEPGGAEALIPVIRLLRAQGRFETHVLGYGHGMARFSRKGINCVGIEPVQEADFTLLDRNAPDMLITSATSLPWVDQSERYLWRQAKERGIPSLAFLDQWQNYAVRFSGRQAHERLACMPDWINCLNEIGRSEMIGEGFDGSRLLALGHPYLSSLRHDRAALDPAGLRDRLHIGAGDKVALFVSEPIREGFGGVRGYDQYGVLDYFISDIAHGEARPKIVVKLHPKDSRASFNDLAKKFETLPLQFVGEELSSLECLAISDFVFGMTSIMLIEAFVLGKSVVSLQPGLCVEDAMVLSRHGLIPVVLSGDRCNLLELDALPRGRFDVEFAADEFLRFLDRTLQ